MQTRRADKSQFRESLNNKVKKTSKELVGTGTTYSYTGVLGGSRVNGE